MRLGLVLECTPEGPDERVLRHWIATHATAVELSVRTLSNKRQLLDDCGKTATNLLADGCDRVVIVWDLYPSWDEGTPCRAEDRQKALASLHAASVPLNCVALVAIESMLECWFLADEKAIGRYANCRRSPGRVDTPEQVRRPKDRLSALFEQCGRRRYSDFTDAVGLAQEIADLARLQRRCPTFDRFWTKATTP